MVACSDICTLDDSEIGISLGVHGYESADQSAKMECHITP